MRDEVAKTPLPPGANLDAVVQRYPRAEPTNGQRAVIVQEVQFNAACRWYAHWLAGDAPTRAIDAVVIGQFPTWEFAQHFAPGDAGPQLLRDLVDQVQNGQETRVRQELGVNC